MSGAGSGRAAPRAGGGGEEAAAGAGYPGPGIVSAFGLAGAAPGGGTDEPDPSAPAAAPPEGAPADPASEEAGRR